ncbi:MAG: valine--tRNA ligase [Candidatus Margulisbacteria bacterium GWF2_35_9]|nr:MAG: valine--tRNA ligase [Candidatus Margulisbacteria bacterium GWF2_35_9]
MRLEKAYNHLEVEDKWYKEWESKGYFKPYGNGDPLSMVIPPPNVTGALHMGHALNNTLQDIVARFYRMQGRKVLWVPGTDHAGIATQNVVEKQLAKEGISREELGRESFLEKVWEWKEKYGNTITGQLRKLGASVDWSRERFTMDEGCSSAVKENFYRLYNDGLIYRDVYIVNWCPRCHTAISDIEVEHETKEGHLWTIKYPLVGGTGKEFIEVATTRPETMFGDTAVAVNQKDKRYTKWIGKKVLLPLMNKEIPIIADDHVDMSFGTGAVKVTPAHDPNDYAIGQRHNLESVIIMDGEAKMNDLVPKKYQGMDRYVCRKQVIEDLESQHFLTKTTPHEHAVGHCYRCNTVIEPYLSKQWFINMEKLADAPIKVVETGEIKFIPSRWEKLYFDWMKNIRPWCISRQIWWGHRIPVWYCDDCNAEIVSKEDVTKCSKCGSTKIHQDEDVLDTWFSSALWPFSTLGWPENTQDLQTFYPTEILITGYDIITFWVSRMITMGLYNMKQIPFSHVYIHGLVRDSKGRKMSKSLGNVVDPLMIIEDKGADVLRYTVASLVTSGGQDIKLMDEKLVSSRNFLNKLWNVSRYILMQETETDTRLGQTIADKWILGELCRVVEETENYYKNYDYNYMIDKIYEFVWGEFCDWYIEMSKLHKAESQATMIYVLNAILKILHPIIPFITEEIWQLVKTHPLCPKDEQSYPSIMLSKWPVVADVKFDNTPVKLFQNIVKAVRNTRAEINVPVSKKGLIVIKGKNAGLQEYVPYFKFLARANDVEFSEITPTVKYAFAVVGDVEVFLPLAGLIDLDAEKTRLDQEKNKLVKDVDILSKKLGNEGFVKNAPAAVVEKETALLEEKKFQLKAVSEKLQNL